jgi:hypothetical protein
MQYLAVHLQATLLASCRGSAFHINDRLRLGPYRGDSPCALQVLVFAFLVCLA